MDQGGDYAKFTVDTTGLYSDNLSLDEECRIARNAWRDSMRKADLHIGLGGFKQVVGEMGRILLAWFRGSDEQIYGVVYDPHKRIITNEPMRGK